MNDRHDSEDTFYHISIKSMWEHFSLLNSCKVYNAHNATHSLKFSYAKKENDFWLKEHRIGAVKKLWKKYEKLLNESVQQIQRTYPVQAYTGLCIKATVTINIPKENFMFCLSPKTSSDSTSSNYYDWWNFWGSLFFFLILIKSFRQQDDVRYRAGTIRRLSFHQGCSLILSQYKEEYLKTPSLFSKFDKWSFWAIKFYPFLPFPFLICLDFDHHFYRKCPSHVRTFAVVSGSYLNIAIRDTDVPSLVFFLNFDQIRLVILLFTQVNCLFYSIRC